MIRAVYHFHVYYHVRQVLKRLLLPHETGLNTADNPYTSSEVFKICEDYRVPNDSRGIGMKNFIGLINMC